MYICIHIRAERFSIVWEDIAKRGFQKPNKKHLIANVALLL